MSTEWFTVAKLSDHMEWTPEGFLLCKDVPIARCGAQLYREGEIEGIDGDDNGWIEVYREPSEVFKPDSVASFQGKPIVNDHPFEMVNPTNYTALALGHITNPRRGQNADNDLLLADMLFTTERGIKLVQGGKRALSVGYKAFYERSARGLGRQYNIIANHVALVDEGRCGARCTIMDGKALYNETAVDLLDEAGFVESEHPRDPAGKFSSGGGAKGPAPHPGSTGQKQIHAIATGSEPTAAKVAAIQAVMKNPKVAGAFTAKFGKEWITALGTGGGAGAGATGAAALKLSGLKKIGKQLGSNPGGQYEAADGQRYYVKLSKSNDHARNEVLASRLYEAAGAPVLRTEKVDMGDGKEGTATAWKPGVALIDRKNPDHLREAQKHFATHAWLANWDAAGLEYDNQGLVDGKMTTLDPGGSLIFRAQGGPKGEAFGNKVQEWDSLRDPSNHQASQIYGGMSKAQLRESAQAVHAVPDATIRKLAMEQGPGNETQRAAIGEKLIARKRDIAKRAGLDTTDSVDYPATEDIGYPRRQPAWWRRFGDIRVILWDEFEEAKHPRVKGGQSGGGQFTSGGGGGGMAAHAATVPGPSAKVVQSHGPSKALAAKVAGALKTGQGLEPLKEEIAAYGAKYQNAGYKTYAKALLAHIAQAVKAGGQPAQKPAAAEEPQSQESYQKWSQAQESYINYANNPAVPLQKKIETLGHVATSFPSHADLIEQLIAKLKSEGPKAEEAANEAAAKAAEEKAKAEAAAKQAAEEAAKKPQGPAAHPGSEGQKAIEEIGKGDDTPANKIAKIQAVMNNGAVSGPYTKKFGEAWIAAIQPPAAAKKPAAAKPAAAPQPAKATGQYGGTLTTAPPTTARYKTAVAAMAKAAKQNGTGKSYGDAATAHAICPSLDKGYWAKADAGTKKALGQYWDGNYDDINAALREQSVKQGIPDLINKIDDQFHEEGSTLQEDVRLTRGETIPAAEIDKMVKQLEAGLPLSYHKEGFISTSMNETPAFSNRNAWLIIAAKKGTPALGIDTLSIHTENEILLRHGQTFEVYQIERTPGRTYLYMTTK